ncbi:zinc finger protein [Trichonephila clavata]|uniref:Zinc finger protein n=1 Tax=Trichonephila clavata TaxID=2740835 RepID=A0A8X6KT33_TRICU|nr:zinc finger protein [Trichonephila clavata]
MSIKLENVEQSVPLIDLVDIANENDLGTLKDEKPDLNELESKQTHMCDMCRKQFSSKSCLNLHYACHLQEQPRVCDVCGESFSQAGDFADHYAQHCIEQEFECFTCEEIFFDRAEFDFHQRLHKVSSGLYSCDECKSTFETEQELREHYRNHVKKTFECPMFRLTRHLDKHRLDCMDYEPEIELSVEEPFDETAYIETDVENSATATTAAT